VGGNQVPLEVEPGCRRSWNRVHVLRTAKGKNLVVVPRPLVASFDAAVGGNQVPLYGNLVAGEAGTRFRPFGGRSG
jgi:hypothetical protein